MYAKDSELVFVEGVGTCLPARPSELGAFAHSSLCAYCGEVDPTGFECHEGCEPAVES